MCEIEDEFKEWKIRQFDLWVSQQQIVQLKGVASEMPEAVEKEVEDGR